MNLSPLNGSRLWHLSMLVLCLCSTGPFAFAKEQRLLYVGTPGIRDYQEYGGHGILVFDLGHGHKFVRRIASAGLDENGKPLNVKGICAARSRESCT
jgi:hypothetical protein